MIDRIFFILKLYIILFSTSCGHGIMKLEESEFISHSDTCVLSVIPQNETIDIGQYLDSAYYVKLELTDESIIGQIDKLIIFEDKIYILDRQTSSVFIFDMTGKYLLKLCKIGNGPGEYNKIHFFGIDEEKRHIVITDLITYWTMRYDLTGKYVSRKKIPFNTLVITPLHGGEYVSYSNFRENSRFLEVDYNIIYLDSLMQIKKVYFPYHSKNFYGPTVQFTSVTGGPFYMFNNEVHFIYSLKNEVYQVVSEGLSLKYKFDFNGKNFKYEAIHKRSGLFEYLNDGRYWTILRVCETENLLSFSFLENMDRILNTGFYSKSTGNVIHSNGFFLNKFRFFISPISSYKDWIISEFQVDDLLEWSKFVNKMYDELKEKGYQGERDLVLGHQALFDRKRMAESLTFDDNPVLMFFKLKPF